MSAEGYPIYWTDERPLNVLIADAQSQQLDYLLVQAIQSPAIDVGSLALNSLTDLVVFRDSSEPDRWSRIRKCLPPKFYFLAARPTDHLAIAIMVRTGVAAFRLRHDNLYRSCHRYFEFEIPVSKPDAGGWPQPVFLAAKYHRTSSEFDESSLSHRPCRFSSRAILDERLL